jgi:hypothetical protein
MNTNNKDYLMSTRKAAFGFNNTSRIKRYFLTLEMGK